MIDFIARLVGPGFFIGVLAGAAALFSYDRRPPDWPSFDLRVWIFHQHVGLPDSLEAQLDNVKQAQAAAAAHAQTIVVRQARITAQAQTNELAAQGAIRWRTRILTGEIPVALPPPVDRAFPLPVGLVRVFDASVRGLDLSSVPDPAGRADDAPSAVTDSAAAGVFVANNGECVADQQRLTALQAWTRSEAAVR